MQTNTVCRNDGDWCALWIQTCIPRRVARLSNKNVAAYHLMCFKFIGFPIRNETCACPCEDPLPNVSHKDQWHPRVLVIRNPEIASERANSERVLVPGRGLFRGCPRPAF